MRRSDEGGISSQLGHLGQRWQAELEQEKVITFQRKLFWALASMGLYVGLILLTGAAVTGALQHHITQGLASVESWVAMIFVLMVAGFTVFGLAQQLMRSHDRVTKVRIDWGQTRSRYKLGVLEDEAGE